MKTFKSFFLIIILGLLFSLSLQKCVHESRKVKPKQIPDETVQGVRPSHQLGADRWAPIRIHTDFTYFNGTTAQLNYIKGMLLPAALDYLKATLKVPQMDTLMTSENKICDEFKTPAIYKTSGVAADLVLMVTGNYDDENFVAFATPCLLLESTGRPIFGWINFNFKFITPTTGPNFDSDVMTAMHEISHVLGISSSLYEFFPAQKKTGITVSNGKRVGFIDLPPLTKRIKQHFNCPSAKGAYLENEGGEGTAGSHLERRIFMNDFMTGSVIPDERVSEFSLAFLEGTGWYQVDYNMADPFLWGKNEGCSFLDGSCRSGDFVEFCKRLGSADCNLHRTHGSFCGSKEGGIDPFADNCPFYLGYPNANCQDPTLASTKILNAEVYGEHSRCFAGTLFQTGPLRDRRTYCLNYNCKKQSNGKFQLVIDLGNSQAVCRSKGLMSVSGYQGKFECPDPDEFCAGAGQKFCKRNCNGRGVCENGICKCVAGYRGPSCMTKVDSFLEGVEILEPAFDPSIDVDFEARFSDDTERSHHRFSGDTERSRHSSYSDEF